MNSTLTHLVQKSIRLTPFFQVARSLYLCRRRITQTKQFPQFGISDFLMIFQILAHHFGVAHRVQATSFRVRSFALQLFGNSFGQVKCR